MTRLDDTIALIAGGTGTVGECVVRAFLRAKATVIVPSRSPDKIAGLREFLGDDATPRLTTLVGDIGDPRGAETLRDQVMERFGGLDAVVASLGGTWEARLPVIETPVATWDEYHQSNLKAHFLAARTLLPVLAGRPGSSYTLLGGLSALVPVPLYGPVAINSAAQLMMARILMQEMKTAQVRINQVMCGYINTRARAGQARPEWITADEVGRFCAYLASSEGAMINGAVLQLGDRPPPGA
jgi:NAD(P)-dependent dehydrogenase (short-subunit alcohol dehydrogenase family)